MNAEPSEKKSAPFPDAVYFDANSLLSTNHDLKSTNFLQFFEIAGKYLPLYVPETAAREILERRTEDALECFNKARSLSARINAEVLVKEWQDEEKITLAVAKQQKNIFANFGITTIPVPDIDFKALHEKFIKKEPPFGKSDRGFKDAVILETIFEHAVKEKFKNILLVTADSGFDHHKIRDRFQKVGISVHVMGGKPDDLLKRTGEHVEASLNREALNKFLEKQKRALNFVEQHKSEVFKFVLENAKMTASRLMFGNLLETLEGADRLPPSSTIESVESVNPVSIEHAFVGLTKEEPIDDRVTVSISVKCEFEVTIEYSTFVEQQIPIGDPIALRQIRNVRSLAQPNLEKRLISRKILVEASILKSDYEKGEFKGFRLVKVL